MKILIVDDSRTIRKILINGFRQAQMDDVICLEADSVDGAMSLLGNNTVDLVITDLNMPNKDGYALLRHVHQEKVGPPVGVMSSQATDEVRSKVLSEGAIFLLRKPFSPMELEQQVNRAIR